MDAASGRVSAVTTPAVPRACQRLRMGRHQAVRREPAARGARLDISATTYRVSKSNIFGLVHALGAETAGAFRFWQGVGAPPSTLTTPPREVTVVG